MKGPVPGQLCRFLLGTWHRKSHNPRGKLTWLAGKWTMNEDVGFLFENGDISLPAMLVYWKVSSLFCHATARSLSMGVLKSQMLEAEWSFQAASMDFLFEFGSPHSNIWVLNPEFSGVALKKMQHLRQFVLMPRCLDPGRLGSMLRLIVVRCSPSQQQVPVVIRISY